MQKTEQQDKVSSTKRISRYSQYMYNKVEVLSIAHLHLLCVSVCVCLYVPVCVCVCLSVCVCVLLVSKQNFFGVHGWSHCYAVLVILVFDTV